jgi:hypothetical protein
MVTGDIYDADPYSLRHHILLQFRKDMLMARYMPLLDCGEDNETEQVCQAAPGEGIESEGGWDILVNKIVVGGPLPLPK